MSNATARELLETLVAFDTTSRDSNLGLIHFVRDYLAGYGVDSLIVPDDSGDKANLIATIGPASVPGIVLSGHTDVVPVDGQTWSSDPFRLTERDGCLYGRGSADMKGFLACVLALVPRLTGMQLSAPVHLAFSHDEETGCLGAPALIDALLEHVETPRACIVGEPTRMDVVTGHKGKVSLRCEVTGRAAHSAVPDDGVNAIEIAARVVVRLRQQAERLRREGPFNDGFTPPYSTLHTGTIAGGAALNIVPASCRFDLELRHLPGVDPETALTELATFAERDLLPGMRAVAPESAVDWQRLAGYPALETADASEVVRLAQSLSDRTATRKVSFGTEGGLFHAAGVPTIVCGPGDIAVAHKPEEYVSIEQLTACSAFLDRLADRLETAAPPGWRPSAD